MINYQSVNCFSIVAAAAPAMGHTTMPARAAPQRHLHLARFRVRQLRVAVLVHELVTATGVLKRDLLNDDVDTDDVTEQFFVNVERQTGIQLFHSADYDVVTVHWFIGS